MSWKRTGPLVDIHRLVVHPDRFRRGIAGRLLDALAEHEPDAERTIVATGAANPPARRLYERRGFAPVEERVVGGSIRIIIYERLVKTPALTASWSGAGSARAPRRRGCAAARA